MTRQQSDIIHTMMATLLSHITPQEASRKTDKLRKAIRFKLNAIHKRDAVYYKEMANSAQVAWDSVERDLQGTNYEVLLSVSLLALYSFIERTEFKDDWFSERVFFDAIGSIEGHYRNPKINDFTKVEHDSNMLVDLLCKAIGVSKPNKLSALKMKIKNEMLLSNVEYKESA